jgi:hypothetical protein
MKFTLGIICLTGVSTKSLNKKMPSLASEGGYSTSTNDEAQLTWRKTVDSAG